MSRIQSREIAFKLLFPLCFDISADILSDEAFSLASSEKLAGPELDYIKTVCTAVQNNLAMIDKQIAEHAKDFSFDRIFKVDLTVLRLAVGEILYMEETPNIAIINEAINLVKKYSTDKSAAYVNGILASVLKLKESGK